MTGINVACFDLFNTLVSVGQVPETVGRFTADILGLERQRWNEACFGPAHEICQPTDPLETLTRLAHSLDPGIPHSLIKHAAKERQQRFDYALINVSSPVLHALTLLREKGIRLALISNASSSEVAAWSASPLAELFEVATFSCYSACRKPDAEIYTTTAGQLGVRPEDCLFVGDGGSDEHHGAHRVGMKPVLVTHFLGESEQQEKLKKYAGVLVGVVQDFYDLHVQWGELTATGTN